MVAATGSLVDPQTMATLTIRSEVDDAGLSALQAPRSGLVAEAPGDGGFVAAEGPVRHYRRTLAVSDGANGRRTAIERVEFALAIPLWWPLFVLPVRMLLRREHQLVLARARRGRGVLEADGAGLPVQPFWAPSDRFSARASSVLALVCALSVAAGYVGTTITQTITYSASQFHRSTGAQGVTLAVVRVGILLALATTALADRRGRRRLLVLTLYGACITAGLGAACPNLVALAITQAVAQGLSTAALLLVGIVVAEEVPAGSRAWATGLLTMTTALGAGVCVWLLPLADLGPNGWRVLYLVALLGVPLTAWAGRHLPETRRFVAHRNDQRWGGLAAGDEAEAEPGGPGARVHTISRRRFWILAVGLFGVAIFAAPATQLLNDFLRHERHYSAAHISAFTLLTNTPAGLGILVGGWLADVRGRRVIAAIGVIGGTILTVAQFASAGAPMWAFAVASSMVAAVAVPVLGVYGPELFPTAARGRAAGMLSVVTVAGSALGLAVGGLLKDGFGHLAPALAILAAAPLIVGVLIVVAYPETSGRELEELNPADRHPPRTA